MPQYYAIVARPLPAGRPADAAPVRLAEPAAQRLRHRPQPAPRRRVRHPGHPAVPRPGTRSRACWPTRSPTSRNRDILISSVAAAVAMGITFAGPHGDVGRHVRRRRTAATATEQRHRRAAHDDPGPDRRRRSSRWRSAGAGSTRPTRRPPDCSAPASRWPGPSRSSRSVPSQIPGDGQPGTGAGLHRQPAPRPADVRQRCSPPTRRPRTGSPGSRSARVALSALVPRRRTVSRGSCRTAAGCRSRAPCRRRSRPAGRRASCRSPGAARPGSVTGCP